MRAKPYGVDAKLIRRAAGLEPLPPRTNLEFRPEPWVAFEGWERAVGSYQARPGEEVTLTVYRPDVPGPYPLIVFASDLWQDGRRAPWAQALGISLALHGFCLIALDPPGAGDRSSMGSPVDPTYSAGIPPVGVLAWDILRAIDVATAHLGVLKERIGLVGAGFGGDAAALAAAIEPKVATLAVTGACSSQEHGLGSVYRSLSGIAAVGDWANVLAHRTDLAILLQAAEQDEPSRVEATAKKLRSALPKAAQPLVKFETYLGGRDLNRRMRESMAAWFLHHLMGRDPQPYVPELIPLTDGQLNARRANTEEPVDLAVPCHSVTLGELRERALMEPYPEISPELIPWGKYGRLEPLAISETLHLVDHGASDSVVALPYVDPEVLVPLGLSVSDFFAQLVHLLLPGGPEGWEPLALQGDALTAMIASVRTLIKGSETKEPPKSVIAEGPISSLIALLLGRLRPQLSIQTTHEFGGWSDVLEAGILVPGARYRIWDLSRPTSGQVPPTPLPESLTADEPVGNKPDAGEQGEGHDEGHERLDDPKHPAEAENRDNDDQAEFHAS